MTGAVPEEKGNGIAAINKKKTLYDRSAYIDVNIKSKIEVPPYPSKLTAERKSILWN